MIDPYKTMKFYDPLYKVITIKPVEKESFAGRKYWSSSFGERTEDGLIESIISRIISCREMARLNFLRQSGPAFLAFPSSTHTRFAHSLGTFYLGLESLERCWVDDNNKKAQLKSFIDNLGWRDEFLLALLLHDIGHLPFSHVVEQNHDLNYHPLKHEDLAASHIMGKIESAWFTQYLYNTYRIENSIQISKLIDVVCKELKVQINKSLICYFITKDNLYIQGNKYTKEAKMLKEMVSGLLDLDRFDHYYRDSFFMGNMLARFNVPIFLDDFILTDHGCKLKADGISQVLSFLQSKENMIKFSFENSENLAYETMLNYSISLYEKFINGKTIKIIINLNKNSFFGLMMNFSQNSYRRITQILKMVYGVMYKRPYTCICKFNATSDKVREVTRH